ncbi:unnamed protein product, partial [Sphenostylis stenocarpa]
DVLARLKNKISWTKLIESTVCDMPRKHSTVESMGYTTFGIFHNTQMIIPFQDFTAPHTFLHFSHHK